jgi:hypothetical protein
MSIVPQGLEESMALTCRSWRHCSAGSQGDTIQLGFQS